MTSKWESRILGPNGPEYRSWATVAIFLAGGISNCPDWQTPTAQSIALNTPDNVLVLNPRLPGTLDPNDATTAVPQIKWEADALRDANMVLFWFPKESVCPITLLELGKELVRAELTNYGRLIVGCEPGYTRTLDVITQCQLVFPDMQIHDNLSDMVDRVYVMYDQDEIDYKNNAK
jgi:hypothetical protein